MAYLKGDFRPILRRAPRIVRNEMEAVHDEFIAVLRLHSIASRYVHHVFFDIFLHHKPRAAAQSEPFPLSDGVKPVAQMGSDPLDRKSTRLNSSHANISYAVFCLKKKK